MVMAAALCVPGVLWVGPPPLAAWPWLLLSTAMKKVVADLESFTLRFENLVGEGAAGGGAPAKAGGAPVDADENVGG